MGITIRRMTKAEQTNERNARAKVGMRGSMLRSVRVEVVRYCSVLSVLEYVYTGSVGCWRSVRA